MNKRQIKKNEKKRLKILDSTIILDYELEFTQSNGEKTIMQIGDFYEYKIDISMLRRGQTQQHDVVEILNFYREDGEIKIKAKIHDRDGYFSHRVYDFKALQELINDEIFTKFVKIDFVPAERPTTEQYR